MEKLARKFGYWIAVRENQHCDFFQARRRSSGLYIGSRINYDPNFTLPSIGNLENIITSSDQLKKFEAGFLPWLQQHKTSKVHGLDQFQADYSEGTTQAFDSFYTRHRTKRFRCFVGEYFYHLKVWQSCNFDWAWTNGQDLEPGDALVLSVPFCDTVVPHKDLDKLLDQCSQKSIPVLLDLCYYTISEHVEVNANHQCVDTVAFSLSKAWPVSTARIGMRYTRPNIFDGQKLHCSIGYNNNLGAAIGNAVLDSYAPDWLVDQRSRQYPVVCTLLGLSPTSSVNFGIGNDLWNNHSRRELLSNYGLSFDPSLFVNRICLNKIYQHWDLFRKFVHHELSIEI
jgi:hypothetical protein